MKLLLYARFERINKDDEILKKFIPKKAKCLFVNYADEDEYYLDSAVCKLEKYVDSIEILNKYTDLLNTYDLVFINCGNNSRLWHYLNKYNQVEFIKNLVINQNVPYIGSSAGSVICGNDFKYSLPYEPFDIEFKSYKGFNFLNNKVFAHACKLRIDAKGQIKKESSYNNYLKYKKPIMKNGDIAIGNNAVVIVEDEKITKKSWTYKELQY